MSLVSMSHCLPEEVVEDIVSRLPVKSLLRFRSVSKTWRSLIDSNYFVQQHLNRSMESNTNRSVLLMSTDQRWEIVGFDSVDRFMESGYIIPHPLTFSRMRSVFVWGSCNGLVCLSWSDGAVVLWNPATLESRELPSCRSNLKLPRYDLECKTHGFWYDSCNDDYKVVRFHLFCSVDDFEWSFQDEVSVYSFKSNSWRTTIVECPQSNSDVHSTDAEQVLINGALHWRESEQGIVAFDLASQMFVAVPPPPTDGYPGGGNQWRLLTDFRGCLSVFFYHTDVGTIVDIWVMKEYGVKESWTNFITITGPELGLARGCRIPCLSPISCSKMGAGILYKQKNYSKCLLCYDFGKKTIQKITLKGVRKYSHSVVYTESLVSLNVGVRDDDGDIQEQRGDQERPT